MGRGSVKQDRGRKTWYFRHDVQVPGQPRSQIRRRGFPTKRDAESALQRSLWETGQAPAPPSAVTVASVVRAWIARRAPGLSPTTVYRYERTLAHHIGPPPLGEIPLSELATQHLQAWVDSRKVRSSSLRTLWRVLSSALKKEVPLQLLAGVTLPRVPRQSMTVWSREQTLELLRLFKGDALYPMVLLAVTTGLRAGELLALRWADLGPKSILVERAAKWTKGAVLVGETKSGRARRVTLYPETLEELGKHRKRQEEKQRLFPDWNQEGLLFPAPRRTGHWCPQYLSHAWTTRLRRYGLPHVPWHSLRHTHVSHLFVANVPLTTISRRIGHASPSVTLSIYSHLVEGQEEEAVRLGSEFLYPTTVPNGAHKPE